MPDLYFSDAEPSGTECKAVDTAVGSLGPATLEITDHLVYSGHKRVQERRHLLLPTLHALQKAVGWISPGGLNYACKVLQIPPAEAFGVVTFYHLFSTEEPDQTPILHVCDDIACQITGGPKLLTELKDEGYGVQSSPCLGQCEKGPAVFIQNVGSTDTTITNADLNNVSSSFTTKVLPELIKIPQAGSKNLHLLRRVGIVNPNSLEDYRNHSGYSALDIALAMGPEAVIKEIIASGLLGRGGAAFPTGIKWQAVANQKDRPSHLVCNADESEPGTFKDRILMEGDPFAVIEAMTIAGIAIGAEKGWLYIRGEYPTATRLLINATESARNAGLLGKNIASSNFSFDIEIRNGAGAYICGEETALFNSIEGYRGEPRNKPPFPTTHGLFNEPTVVNNVETLANVPHILIDGGTTYASRGTKNSTGTRLFCVSGRVTEPGLYEFEFGITLKELLEKAGGFSGPGELKTILLGGAAGSFVNSTTFDLPLTFEATREIGLSLGSGVVMAFSDQDNLSEIVKRIATFFKNESCGQCVPCRIGTVRQEELLIRIENGASFDNERKLFKDLSTVMSDASICGLGHTASSAISSAFELGLLEPIQ